METIKSILEELTEILKQMCDGKYAMALAGSHAKGSADNGSDIDIFMYVENEKQYEQRQEIIKTIADKNMPMWVSENLDEPWGGNMDFYYKNVPVEVTLRKISTTDSDIQNSIEGNIEIIPALWTTNGFYSYICLSEIDFIKIIDDPYDIIKNYKSQISVYPPKLKEAILEQFFDRCNAWLDNFHYKSAIEREDIFFTGSIVKSTVLDMIQVIFAINEKYFTGDKKLEWQLNKLPYCPHKLSQNIEFLMSAPKNKEKLEQQRDLLIQIRDRLQYKINEE